MQCETVKVVAPVSDDNQLGYVVINKSDLTEKHELFEEADGAGESGIAKMTVAELKDALTAKGIVFPDNAKKADLVALLTTA